MSKLANGQVTLKAHQKLRPACQPPVCESIQSERVAIGPNENKMTDGGRGRASLGLKVWKSSQKVEGATVRRLLQFHGWVFVGLLATVAQRSERSSITSSSPSSPSHISSRASWNPHFCKTRIEAKLCFATCAKTGRASILVKNWARAAVAIPFPQCALPSQ